MEVTRQWGAEAALAVAFAVGAVVLDRPLSLVGAAGIGAWLVASQVAFVRRVTAVEDSIRADHAASPETVAVDDDVTLRLAVELPRPAPLDVTVSASPPVAASDLNPDERTATIRAGDRRAETTVTVHPQIAGRHEFDRPRVTVETALFRSTFRIGEPASVTAEPRVPRNVHVGAGGERFAAPFGDQPTDRQGQGLELAGVRRYVPGDAAAHIDWKATARRGEPHVVEFEAETDLQSALVVDHRAAMGDGPESGTKLAYVREVALAYLRAAQRDNVPVGLFTVGEDGVTSRELPSADTATYTRVRTRLHDIEPTDDGRTVRDASGHRTGAPPRAAGNIQAVADRLAGDRSPFGTALRPFFDVAPGRVDHTTESPLFETLRAELPRLRDQTVALVFTDDTRRRETREALRAIQRSDHWAVAYLTPSPLFEPGGVTDVDAAYDSYVGFEEFRRALVREERTTAYEVGPRDRLEALLAAGRRRRATQ